MTAETTANRLVTLWSERLSTALRAELAAALPAPFVDAIVRDGRREDAARFASAALDGGSKTSALAKLAIVGPSVVAQLDAHERRQRRRARLPKRRTTRLYPRAVKIKMSAYDRKRPVVREAAWAARDARSARGPHAINAHAIQHQRRRPLSRTIRRIGYPTVRESGLGFEIRGFPGIFVLAAAGNPMVSGSVIE